MLARRRPRRAPPGVGCLGGLRGHADRTLTIHFTRLVVACRQPPADHSSHAARPRGAAAAGALLSRGVLSDTIVLGLAAPVSSSYLGRRTRQVMNLEESAVSVYRVTDLIGTSSESWQDAATTALTEARKTLRNLRVAEIVEQDIDIDEGGAFTYRTKLRVSFKYESEQ